MGSDMLWDSNGVQWVVKIYDLMHRIDYSNTIYVENTLGNDQGSINTR